MTKLRKAGVAAAAVAAVAVPVGLATAQSGSPPTVTSSPATSVSDTAATLNGSVNPNGSATNYAFQWGPTNGYGHETTLTSGGSGTTASTVSATVNGLTPGTAYHFRIIAINSGGTAVGSDQTFTTTGTAPAPSTPPKATTGAPSGVGQTGATVNGTVNPAGQDTTYYFEYGPTANYGIETAATSGGSGSTDETASANLTGLTAATTYHYRLVAVNPGGTTLGTDQTFTTSATTQSQVTFIGREGFVSPGRIIGVEAGCFGGTSNCTGTVSLSRNGTVLGQTNYNIAPNSGGFQNIELSSQGAQMLLAYNHLFHLLPVVATITPTGGQPITHVFHLARWIWH
jgi:phosphodiesterase/alkaline phosphatase D-like protein